MQYILTEAEYSEYCKLQELYDSVCLSNLQLVDELAEAQAKLIEANNKLLTSKPAEQLFPTTPTQQPITIKPKKKTNYFHWSALSTNVLHASAKSTSNSVKSITYLKQKTGNPSAASIRAKANSEGLKFKGGLIYEKTATN